MRNLSEAECEMIRENSRQGVGKFIKKKRLKDGATQEDVANELGVTRAEISYYESGSRDMPLSSFFVMGKCLDFDLKDYVIEIDSYKAVDLFEKAIYREQGKDKPFKIGYVTPLLDIKHTKTERKELLSQALKIYFDSDVSAESKKMLSVADMLYKIVNDKEIMNSVYVHIVNNIADTGNERMNALIREYISIIENER